MVKLIFLIGFLVICEASQVIKHGDLVVFRELAVSNKDGKAYKRSGHPGTVFQVFKAPYYKSPGNAIMTGKTVLLTVANNTKRCDFEPVVRTLMCSKKPDTSRQPTVRILDKHGMDNIPLVNDQLIKFRMVEKGGYKVNIDCSAYGSQPLSCLVKKPQNTYGFIVALAA